MPMRWVVMALVLVVVMGGGPGLCADDREVCAERIARLGTACLAYMAEHSGELPPRLSVLLYQGYVEDLADFACPGQPQPLTAREAIDEASGYVLDAGPADQKPRPLLRDRSAANHGGEGLHVFHDDRQVRWSPSVAEPAPAPVPDVTPPSGTPGPGRVTRNVFCTVGASVLLGVRTTPCTVDRALVGDIRKALEEMVPGVDLSELGIDLEALPLDTGQRVEALQDGSVAAWWGVQVGDVLLTLGLAPLGEGGLSGTVREYDNGDCVPLLLLRDGQLQPLVVDLLDLPARIREGLRYPAEDLERDASGPPGYRLRLSTRATPSAGWLEAEGEVAQDVAAVACVLEHTDAPAGTLVAARWYEGTTARCEVLAVISGSGAVVAALLPGARSPLSAGPWHVSVWVGSTGAGRLDFEVR